MAKARSSSPGSMPYRSSPSSADSVRRTSSCGQAATKQLHHQLGKDGPTDALIGTHAERSDLSAQEALQVRLGGMNARDDRGAHE